MKIKKIYKNFDEIILRRGYEYYKNGHVSNVYEVPEGYNGIVIGSNRYLVNINIVKDNYLLSCDCPCEYNCKHMAAVLYYLKKGCRNKKINSINVKVNNIKDLRKYLNNRLRNLKISKKFGKINYGDLYEIIKNIFEIIKDEKNIDKYFDYCLEIQKWFDDNNGGCYEIIGIDEFEKQINNNKMLEGNEIHVQDIYMLIIDNFFKCFQNSSEYLKIYLSYLDFKYEEDVGNGYFELLYISSNIDSKELAEGMILFIKYILKSSPSYLKDNLLQMVLKLKYNYLDKEMVILEARKHLSLKSNRKFLLEYYKENDLDMYIELLEKVISMNINCVEKEKYINILIKIYKDENDKDKYLEYVKLNYKLFPSFDKYLLIKSLYSKDQWLDMKLEYINQHKINKGLYIEICLEEKMYDELFQYMEKIDIDIILKYIEELKKINSERIYEILKIKIIDSVKLSFNGRKSYEVITRNLFELYSINNNKTRIMELIKNFKKDYKNRKAFIEELDFFLDTYID